MLSDKRIGLLSHWLSSRNGGVFEAVVQAAHMLRSFGATPVIIGLRDSRQPRDVGRFGEADVLAFDNWRALWRSMDDLVHAKLNLLHLHGLWTPASIIGTRWKRRTAQPYVISPHGMLDPYILSRNAWKKRLGILAFERANWRAADAFHALTLVEAGQISGMAPGAVIETIPNAAPPVGRVRSTLPPPRFLYLGRLHPKKNLSALIEAWRSAREGMPHDSELLICGPGETGYIRALRNAAAGVPSIRFENAVEGEAKRQLLRTARFLVLPSLSEGLPMVVLESWAEGTPVLMSEACGLPIGFERQAASKTATGATEIAEGLLQSASIDEQRWLSMSRSAKSLATGEFGAQTLAPQWEQFYQSMLE